MTVLSVVVGGTTDSSAVVVGQVASVSSVRLAFSGDEAMSNPNFVGPETPSAQGMVRFQVTGLLPNSRHFYRLETDGALDGPVGQFRTHPPLGVGNSDVVIAAAGDAGRTPDAPGVAGSLIPQRISNHPVHTLIADLHDPLMFVHLGDEGYYNIGSGETWTDGNGDPIVLGDDLATYRRQYEDVLLQPHQAYLARRVARVHVWDDHEFGGGPDVGSDRLLPGRDNACTVYREREAHYPLPAGPGANPVYHSTQIDRTLYVFLDTRSDRDPNDAPAGPTKTMLGSSQRAWLANLLANSAAEALVLITSTSWLGVGADSWNSYQDEQAQLIQLFATTGFLDSMVVVTANTHFLAIEDGSNNSAGGMPVYVFAPLDSSPTTSSVHDYSLGRQAAQSGQYGTLRVRDTGDTIEITGTGWAGDTIWQAFTLTVGEVVEPEPEPPPAAPAPVAVARPTRRVTWLAVNSRSGRIIHELPDVHGPVKRLLSAYESSVLELPIPLNGPAHVPIALLEQATFPLATALVAVVNDLPTWMGLVVPRRGGTEATARLGAVTPEAYLRRRRIKDHNFFELDRALVAAALVADAETMPGVGDGGLGFTLDVELTGDPISRTYLATDRQSVYAGLRELAADGLEFTVDLDWLDAKQTRVRKLLRIKPRIGKAAGGALFETTASSMLESRSGSEATYELLEDFSVGRYANHVTVIAPGEGEDQPASIPAIDQAAIDGGMPIVEHVVEVSTPSAASQSDLDIMAQAELSRLRHGAQVWDISARLNAYPRLGIDAQLGDRVAWKLVGHRHPNGITGAGRMVGYEVDEQAGKWRPVLLDPQEA